MHLDTKDIYLLPHVLRAKVYFPIHLKNNKNLTKGKISHNILPYNVLENAFQHRLINTDFRAFYLSC